MFALRTAAPLLALALTACASAAQREYRAYKEAALAGDYRRAEELLGALRQRAPGSTHYMVEHAALRLRMNDAAGAFALLDKAATGGLADASFADDPAFDAVLDDPRLQAVAERVAANAAVRRARVAEAQKPQDPAQAPVFRSLEQLRAARDADERSTYEGKAEDYPVRRALWQERWAAALQRHADDRRGTPERESALVELVRHRLRPLSPIDLRWDRIQGTKAGDAAEAYLAEYPHGTHVSEARVTRAAMIAGSVIPEDYDYAKDEVPRPDCVAALPELTDLADDGPANRWSTAALGLQTLCLAETKGASEDRLRAKANQYLDAPEPDWREALSYDWMLPRALQILLWKIDGLPALAGEGLDGKRVDLAGFRGKITLIDFWGPG